MQVTTSAGADDGSVRHAIDIGLLDLLGMVGNDWKRVCGGALLCGALAFGAASLVAPSFTARTTFLPPQQAQSSGAAAALSSLGALGALAGGVGMKTPADQYASMALSRTVSDQIIDQFELMKVYDEKLRDDVRKELGENVRVLIGKKDGLITIEVDDKSPERATKMANAYVGRLRALADTLAVTEAQQRRRFFEQQLTMTRDRLTQAQVALQGSGYSQGVLKAEPKAAAELYARLRAELTAATVKLETLGSMLTDRAPELQQQRALVQALRTQITNVEQKSDAPVSGAGSAGSDAGYIGKYREFKYQETLFELFARQYEMARVDEAREGGLIQVLDEAVVPERKSKPKRGLLAAGVAAAVLVLLSAWTVMAQIGAALRRQPRV